MCIRWKLPFIGIVLSIGVGNIEMCRLEPTLIVDARFVRQGA